MTLEPEDIPAFLLVLASTLAALLILGFVALRVPWPFRPTAVEVGHAPLYTARVGAVLGSTFLSAPFVRVTTYDDFVVIAPILLRPHVLRRADGVRVVREELRGALPGLRQSTLVLRHAVPRVPEHLRLIPRVPDALEAALTRSLSPAPAERRLPGPS